MRCYYHKSDLDGECSGAIIKLRFPECKMYPVDYGQKFSFKKIDGESVYVVDFTFMPFEQMIELDKFSDLVWIDHHITAIEEANKLHFKPPGIRDINYAACELTWKYCFPESDIPLGVRLIGRYDIWDHNWFDDESSYSTPSVISFQYGMKMLDSNPQSSIWFDLVKNNKHFIDRTIKVGNIIYKYENKMNSRYVNGLGFTTRFEKLNCVCCNKGLTNSKLFDSLQSIDQYDMMITFCRTKNCAWLVTLYTIHDKIDCGEIAKKYGGGGHKKAAGFRCKELPFNI